MIMRMRLCNNSPYAVSFDFLDSLIERPLADVSHTLGVENYSLVALNLEVESDFPGYQNGTSVWRWLGLRSTAITQRT